MIMRSILDLVGRALRCSSGTASIEAVLVLPVSIALMAGGTEFARGFSHYSTADKAMRGAARYLARVPEDAICSWGLNNARNLAVYGKLVPGGADPLIPGWTTDTVTSPTCDGAFPAEIVIQLQTSLPFTFEMLSAVGLSNEITINVKHEERHIGD